MTDTDRTIIRTMRAATYGVMILIGLFIGWLVADVNVRSDVRALERRIDKLERGRVER